jgi:hypothetical protein
LCEVELVTGNVTAGVIDQIVPPSAHATQCNDHSHRVKTPKDINQKLVWQPLDRHLADDVDHIHGHGTHLGAPRFAFAVRASDAVVGGSAGISVRRVFAWSEVFVE